MKPAWRRAAEYVRIDLEETRAALLERYGVWLAEEGRRGGGIGPDEVTRIGRRHLADSLLFASQLPSDVAEVWDLGSGVGLPGIPLAIALPETRFLLIDRSGRRVDLMRRAIRILELDNCQVMHGEIADLKGEVDGIVSRASLPPDELRDLVADHLAPGGTAVVAGSWRRRPEHAGWTTVEIPSYVLDQTVWLLIMRPE